MKLQNKVAVVTGGAMGNGYGIAEVFLKYGAKVIILDNSEQLGASLQSLKKPNNEVYGFQVDIRNMVMVKSCMEHIQNRFGLKIWMMR